MKLVEKLTINGADCQLAGGRVILELSAIGRAEFTVIWAAVAPKMLVSYSCGYSQHEALTQVFTGYVETVTTIDGQRAQVFCREMAGLLAYPLPISLRHAGMADVLAEASKACGLRFALGGVDYAEKKAPHFVNTGTGLMLVSALPKVYGIDDFIWQQQGAAVFVGSWSDSRHAGLDVDVPDSLLSDHVGNYSAKMPTSPVVKPGAVVNGRRLKMVEYSGIFSNLMWF